MLQPRIRFLSRARLRVLLLGGVLLLWGQVLAILQAALLGRESPQAPLLSRFPSLRRGSFQNRGLQGQCLGRKMQKPRCWQGELSHTMNSSEAAFLAIF